MPAQYVKPYVQTNKSDFLDAEAIAESCNERRNRSPFADLTETASFAE